MTDPYAKWDVSRETMQDLEAYVSLIQKWNPKINLVSKLSLNDVWGRHIWDSWQIVDYCSETDGKWLDLGSGGGLPGILLAIHAKHYRPDRTICMIESDARKVQFLRTVVRQLNLNATVINERIEKVPSMDAKVVTSRALAHLSVLLDFAALHLSVNGVLLIHKGGRFQQEIDQARQNWNFECTVNPSKTDPMAAILKIGAISHVGR